MSTELYFTYQLYAAIGLGAVIGIERQWRRSLAGLRTNALVSGGACAFALAGMLIHGDSTAQARIVSYIISGVGFLGAGVIFKNDTRVHGLDTAATVWCSAAIGVLTGLGSPACASILTISVIIINVLTRPISAWFDDHGTRDSLAESGSVNPVIENGTKQPFLSPMTHRSHDWQNQ